MKNRTQSSHSLLLLHLLGIFATHISVLWGFMYFVRMLRAFNLLKLNTKKYLTPELVIGRRQICEKDTFWQKIFKDFWLIYVTCWVAKSFVQMLCVTAKALDLHWIQLKGLKCFPVGLWVLPHIERQAILKIAVFLKTIPKNIVWHVCKIKWF